MAIPFSYNLRNLRLRLGATVMTAMGIALTVAIAIFIMALLAGLKAAFVTSGDPLNVLVMRKGSQAELSSSVDRPALQAMKYLPGIARDAHGEPEVSPEMVVVIVLPRRDGTGEVNVTVRGMTPMGIEMRPAIHLASGRWFNPGQREIVVSNSIHQRFGHANLGDTVSFGKGEWTVVGVFDAGHTSSDSEIWTDVNQMATDFDRPVFSSVLLHADSAVAADALAHRVSEDQRLELDGMLESAYYAEQTKSGAPIQFVGTVVAFIMAIGSCFAAMNTMYAAVAYRGREIATLRILGFSRPSILTSFVLESIALSLLGGLAGILLMLPFNGMTTGTSNAVTFSEVVFRLQLTPALLLKAIAFSAIMGLIGGLAPAWQASRRDIVAALRS
ncbi:MAG: ABC transporter permease [Terriglobales bacterium]